MTLKPEQTTLPALPVSVLTKHQKKILEPKYWTEHGKPHAIVVEIRYDDECGNGHNSFAITADLYSSDRYPGESTLKTAEGETLWCYGGGCCHKEVIKHFPELEPFIVWHLYSSDGPMHYQANAKYWAGHCKSIASESNYPAGLEQLKTTIAYGKLPTDKEFDLEDHLYSNARGWTWNEQKAIDLNQWLAGRAVALAEAFKADIEKLGLVY